MFALGPGEIFLILGAAFIILGPDKLPEAARSMGKMMSKMNQEINDIKSGVFDDDAHK